MSLLITVTGTDRPGITSALLNQLPAGVDVRDVEQVVVRDRLTLALLIDPVARPELLTALLEQFARDQGMRVDVTAAPAQPDRSAGRANVVVMAPVIASDALAAITSDITVSGANIDRIRRLADEPVTALEFDVSGADLDTLRRQLALDATAYGVDIAVARGGLERRGHRLVVMDVDSTFIQDEVIELLAAHAGTQPQVREITERAMRGELDFAASLRDRVATLAGLPVGVLADVRREVRLTPGARTLVATLHGLGCQVALVSGGFAEVVGPLAADLGIGLTHANRLAVRDGRLTGEVDGPVVDRAAKADALRRFAAQVGVSPARTVAIGDGANDLDMLAAAGLGIAFNAKPVVRAQAHTSVSVPRLDTVLYLLGISRADLIADPDDIGADDTDPGDTRPGPDPSGLPGAPGGTA